MKKILLVLCVSMLVFWGIAETANAYSATFFTDGVNIEPEPPVVHQNPTILVIVQGRPDSAASIVKPPTIDFTNFDLSVDLYFEYDPTNAGSPLVVIPDTRSTTTVDQVAVVSDPSFGYDDITSPNGLSFGTPSAENIGFDDVVVFLMDTGDYFKIGNFGLLQDDPWTLTFDVSTLDDVAGVIPEPATLLLLGLGLLGLAGFKRRSKKIQRIMRLFLLLVLMGATGILLSLAQPAMAADDVYEENDTLATATPLTENTELSAIAANGDADWYKIEVGPFVDLAQIQVEVNFDSYLSSKSIGLYDDSENWLTANREWTDGGKKLVIDYVGADNSTYYLSITSYTAGETGYTVEWSANNLPAINLSENTSYPAPGTPTDDDWYKIEVDSCDSPVQILIVAQFSAAGSAREMQLYDTSGNSLYFIEANAAESILDYVGPKPTTPTTYYIRVDDEGDSYSLQWNASHSMPCDGARFFGILPYGGRWYDVSQEGTKLCWAAAASNFLHWTQWRECGDECFPPSSVTLLFDEFEASWDDAGNLPYYGWYWYFNGDTGLNLPQKSGWSQPSGGGNHYSGQGLSLSDYYKYWGQWNSVPAIEEFLHEEYGVVVGAYSDITATLDSNLGHALSVWGYEFDSNGDTTGLWVTDSNDLVDGLALIDVELDPDYYLWKFKGGLYDGWFIGGVHSLKVRYDQSFKYVIKANAVGPGSIVPGNADAILLPVAGEENAVRVGVVDGDDQTFTITPRPLELLVDNVDVLNTTLCPLAATECSYTLTGVNADHTIQAIFLNSGMVTITPGADTGGTISPNVPIKVKSGENATFYFKADTLPDPGYRVMDVQVKEFGGNWVSQGPVRRFTLEGVTVDHEIKGTFTASTDKLAVVKMECFVDSNPVACGSCGETLWVGDQKLESSDNLVVVPFSTDNALVLQTTIDETPQCTLIDVTYSTPDGGTADGIFDVEDDVILTGVIGRCNSC